MVVAQVAKSIEEEEEEGGGGANHSGGRWWWSGGGGGGGGGGAPGAGPLRPVAVPRDAKDPEVIRILKATCHYEVLALPRPTFGSGGGGGSATSEADARRAHRRAALACHPDKCKDPHAAKAFGRVTEALDALGEASRKAEYDGLLERCEKRQRASAEAAAAPPPPPRPHAHDSHGGGGGGGGGRRRGGGRR